MFGVWCFVVDESEGGIEPGDDDGVIHSLFASSIAHRNFAGTSFVIGMVMNRLFILASCLRA